jgi:AhpC/TSA family protein
MQALALLAFGLVWPIQEDPASGFDALAKEYEGAFERWVQEGSRLGPAEARPPLPGAEFWGRFEALSAEGEGRATLWLLSNLQPGKGSTLLAHVERGGEADWVPSALHFLGAAHASFEHDALVALLEQRMVTAHGNAVRAAAALALASMDAPGDAAGVAYLRLWSAALVHDGRDLAPGEELAAGQLDALAEKLIGGLEKESRAHFARAYRLGSDDTYYPIAGAPADPEEVWRPAVEELARRGAVRAQLWALENAPWEVDAAAKLRLKGYLEAVAAKPLPEAELASFGYEISGLVYRLGLAAVEPCIRTMLENSPEKLRPGLLFGLGDAVCESSEGSGDAVARRERGLAILREVQTSWPDSGDAKRAEGRIFRYTNLLVGKVAPDFETVDADGNSFKLSDYRGKITVIDFWGFW